MNAQDLFERLADMPPGRPALIGVNSVLDHAALLREVSGVSARLRERGTRVFATMLDNGLAWGVADLAALRQRVVHVPIPAFFTPQQTTYVLDAAGIDTILSAGPVSGFETESVDIAGERLAFSTRCVRSVPVHEGTAKITFTSGSTGTPKGVCLSNEACPPVAHGLASAMAPLSVKRHLCALPLAT